MNIPKKPTAGPAPRSASGKSSYKRTVTVAATFVLATAFALAAAPAATAAPASTSHGDCNGECPWECQWPFGCQS
jgi:hypothetical protein